MSRRKREILGAFFALLGGMCWGLSGSVGQYLFTYEGMDSRWLVPIRLGLAGIVLFFYCAVKYKQEMLRPWRTVRDLRELLLYGIAGISCCQFLYFTAIQYSTAATATILQSTSPIIILAATCILSRRRPRIREVVSIALALAGVVLITTHGDISHLSVSLAAIAAGEASAFCVMIYNVGSKHLLSEYPLTILQSWAFLLGSAVFFLLFRPWSFSYRPTAIGCAGILFVALVGNILAFIAYMTGVRLIGPNKAILYGFAEPVTAAVVGIFLFHNVFTAADLIGFLFIFLMMVLIGQSDNKRESASSTP